MKLTGIQVSVTKHSTEWQNIVPFYEENQGIGILEPTVLFNPKK